MNCTRYFSTTIKKMEKQSDHAILILYLIRARQWIPVCILYSLLVKFSNYVTHVHNLISPVYFLTTGAVILPSMHYFSSMTPCNIMNLAFHFKVIVIAGIQCSGILTGIDTSSSNEILSYISIIKVLSISRQVLNNSYTDRPIKPMWK